MYAQLEKAEIIHENRMYNWNRYYELLKELEDNGIIQLPIIPEGCIHNDHMFYIKAKDLEERTRLISFLKKIIYGVYFIIFLCIQPQLNKSLVVFVVKINLLQNKVKG